MNRVVRNNTELEVFTIEEDIKTRCRIEPVIICLNN